MEDQIYAQLGVVLNDIIKRNYPEYKTEALHTIVFMPKYGSSHLDIERYIRFEPINKESL